MMRIASQISLFFLLLVGVACSNFTAVEKVELTEENSVLISHQEGEVRVPLSPKRVVLFDYGAMDSFQVLDLEENVIGLPKHNVPKYLQSVKNLDKMENVGGLMEPNFQKIVELDPDLIIIGMRQVADYKEFSDIAPTIIYEMDYLNFIASVEKNIENFGRIFQIEDKSEQAIADLNQTLSTEKAKLEGQDLNALIVMYNDGKFSAYGKGSRFGIVHDYFGIPAVVENLEVSRHGNSISSEFIQEHNPDLLYVLDRNAAISNEAIHKESIENNLIKETSAYKNGKITYLSPDVWYLSGGGLEALEIMAKEVGNSL